MCTCKSTILQQCTCTHSVCRFPLLRIYRQNLSYLRYGRENRKLKTSLLPAALAYGLIRRGCSPANLASARYAMAAWWARPTADKGWPGDQARPRGLKPRAAAAAAARRVPSRWQRSSRAAGDRLLSGAGDQAGGCSGLQGGEPIFNIV